MVGEDFASVRVEVCRACAGIWFEQDQLARVDHANKGAGPALQRALAVPASTIGARRPLSCTRCSVAMVDEPHDLHAAVHVDRCRTCGGIFLDGGELAALRARPLTPDEAARAASRRRRRRRRLREKREAELGWQCDVALLLGILMA